MAVTKAQQAATNRYIRKNYDRAEVFFPKGTKSDIKDHAYAMGESMNAFINRAVAETMSRDNIAKREG